MKKNKTGKSMGSEGRHIGATAENISRGHSRSIQEHQEAGAASRQQTGGQHDGSAAPERERSERGQQRKG